MDKFPLIYAGRSVGELTVEQEGLYTRFSAVCQLPKEGVWCAWAVGEQGEVRIGVLEPCGLEASISRRFSNRLTAPLGPLRTGELRPAGEQTDCRDWKAVKRPEDWFRTPWLCMQLRSLQGVLAVREGTVCQIAIPYEAKQPFPITQLFCFARIATVAGRRCVLYAFDQNDLPIFR